MKIKIIKISKTFSIIVINGGYIEKIHNYTRERFFLNEKTIVNTSNYCYSIYTMEAKGDYIIEHDDYIRLKEIFKDNFVNRK